MEVQEVEQLIKEATQLISEAMDEAAALAVVAVEKYDASLQTFCKRVAEDAGMPDAWNALRVRAQRLQKRRSEEVSERTDRETRDQSAIRRALSKPNRVEEIAQNPIIRETVTRQIREETRETIKDTATSQRLQEQREIIDEQSQYAWESIINRILRAQSDAVELAGRRGIKTEEERKQLEQARDESDRLWNMTLAGESETWSQSDREFLERIESGLI